MLIPLETRRCLLAVEGEEQTISLDPLIRRNCLYEVDRLSLDLLDLEVVEPPAMLITTCLVLAAATTRIMPSMPNPD